MLVLKIPVQQRLFKWVWKAFSGANKIVTLSMSPHPRISRPQLFRTGLEGANAHQRRVKNIATRSGPTEAEERGKDGFVIIPGCPSLR